MRSLGGTDLAPRGLSKEQLMNNSIFEEEADVTELAQLEWLQGHVQSKVRGRIRSLRILHRGGGLILRGTAFSFYGKQLAQEAVMAVSDLPIVANEILVM
jgi:hypothetical protein